MEICSFDYFYKHFVVKELPQGVHISRENAENWYNSVLDCEPERFWWHFKRLKGLGGSDIGEVAVWKMGLPNQFKTPVDIVKDKLMQTPIEPQTRPMRRGTLLEPITQTMFLEDYGAVSREDIIKKIQDQKSDKHPWMSANVDDVVEMDDQIYIVDYKSSSHIPGAAPVPYAGQVHQYDFLFSLAKGEDSLKSGKSASDGLIICYFDYDNGTVRPIEVPFDAKLMQAVVEGGDEVWEHVLNGTYPEILSAQKESIDFDEDKMGKIYQIEKEVISLNLLSCAAKECAQDKQKELANILSDNGRVSLKDIKPPLKTLSTTVRCSVSEEEIALMLSSSSIKEEDIQKNGTKLDEKKVKSFLKQHKAKIKDFQEKTYDPEKIKKVCEEKNLAFPYTQSASFVARSNDKKLDPIKIEGAKKTCREIIEGQVEVLSFDLLKSSLEDSPKGPLEGLTMD